MSSSIGFRSQAGNGEVQAIGCVAQVILTVVFFVVAVVVGGILRTEVDLPAGTFGTSSGPSVQFEETFTARHWVFGLVQGQQADVESTLEKYIRPGERVSSVYVQTHRSALDLLLTVVTLGIYCPVSVTLHGVVVKESPTGRVGRDTRPEPLSAERPTDVSAFHRERPIRGSNRT